MGCHTPARHVLQNWKLNLQDIFQSQEQICALLQVGNFIWPDGDIPFKASPLFDADSHRFLCLPLRLPPWTVPCRIVLVSPDNRDTCPYHFGLRLFTEVRRSSYGPKAFPILAFTSSLVMWSLYEIPKGESWGEEGGGGSYYWLVV